MMPTWIRGTVLLLLVAAGGGVIGYGIGVTPRERSPAADPMEPHQFVARLGRDLDLDAAQRASIMAILERRQMAIDSAWRALRPVVRATIDSAQTEIVAVLHPDQRGRYAELFRAAHGRMGDSMMPPR